MAFVYLDGDFVLESEAKISVFNRGFLFGDGVYATIQVNEGKALFLERHLERLIRQAKSFGLEVPLIPRDVIEQLIKKNEATSGIWKLKVIVIAGEEPEIFLQDRKAKHLLITLQPFTPAPYAALKLGIFPTPVVTAHTSFKSLAHLGRYFVMEHARKCGLDDALTTNEQGILLEASFGNIFWVEGDKLYTPDPALPLHFGVTITTIIERVQEQNWKVIFVKNSLQEIPEKAFVFRCNTMSGVRSVTQIEGREFSRENSLEEMLRKWFNPERLGLLLV